MTAHRIGSMRRELAPASLKLPKVCAMAPSMKELAERRPAGRPQFAQAGKGATDAQKSVAHAS